jgi:flagellar assembly factor FliW
MLTGEMRMTGSGTAMFAQAALQAQPLAAEKEQIESRFGVVQLSLADAITFGSGLLGMPDKNKFCLVPFPSEKMANFSLLQSVEDKTLSFITLPMEVENTIVDKADIAQAAKDLSIPLEHLALLLIVSVHREAAGVRLSVNARAPLFLHAELRTGTQYVFPSNKYNIRHMITL